MIRIPSADEQVAFLSNVQRLLSEGSFSASYKFALVLSLADLAVERGDEGGGALRLTSHELAEKFVAYYWRQGAPYPAASAPKVPTQNRERQKQAAVITAIRVRLHHRTLARLRADRPAWSSLLAAVATTIKVQPLWKLQVLGSEVVAFLYQNAGKGDSITLLPGVAWTLRRHHALIENLVRGHRASDLPPVSVQVSARCPAA